MFDGMPEQFYQFLAAAATATSRTSATTTATTASSLPLPLSFSLHHHHHHHAASFPPYSPPPPPPPPPPPAFDASYHHLLHHPQFRYEVKEETTTTLNLQDGTTAQRLLMFADQIPWSNDEMLALFKIRSSMDNTWFPDFIWENVSRKLAELGFKRSAEKCKEKFEEETRSFNGSIVINNNCSTKINNYRLFGELEELCNNNTTTNANNIDDNNNNNIGDDHHQQSPLYQPPISEQNDHPQTSLSQRGDFPGGDTIEDDQDDDDDDDDYDDAELAEEKRGERSGDDEERDFDTRNEDGNGEDEQSVGDSEKTEECTKKVMRKRKRQKKFEMFKGFCEKIVNKMMAQQEDLHCKILQNMVKRDEENIAREEAWKKQEIEKLQKELEVRAHEQAISGDRQAKILDILNKFSTSSSNILESRHSLKETLENLIKVPNIITLSNSSILTQDSISAQLQPTSPCTTFDHSSHTPLVSHQTCPNIPSSSSNENLAILSSVRLDSSKSTLPMSSSCSVDQASQNPNCLPSQNKNDSSRLPSLVLSNHSSKLDHTSTNATDQITDFRTLENPNDLKVVIGKGKDDSGRRWPRDEVLALINIRCSLFNNRGGDAHHEKAESFSKGPLWERISQKMMELGYKRSAKRCKEKWENINKYFRKTKDLNKKRSIDSRTCPYFHQLSHLYSLGALVGPTDRPSNLPGSPENRSMTFSGAQGGSSTPAKGATNASQGNEGVVQVPGFDFEY